MENWSYLFSVIDASAAYFTLQLTRCVIFSYALIVGVMLLQRILFRKSAFARAVLWALFLLIPFMGKMKLFYENALVIKATWWMTNGIMTYTWTAHVYMAGVAISFLYIFEKRVRLYKAVSRMEKQTVNGRTVRITEMKVTPFTVGLLCPKIVLPKVMSDNYDRDEIEEIIRHEQTHIRLGHLWCYFAWDILRCLLWLNPLLICCQRYFRADMEDMCDRVCIQNSEKTAQEYGRLLVKTLRLLRSEQDSVSSVATYAGEKDFTDMKKRMEKIADFRSYRKVLCRSMAAAAVVLLFIAFMGINSVSYARCNQLEQVSVYSEEGEEILISNEELLCRAIAYDDDYIYIDIEILEDLLKDITEDDVIISVGGYFKLPGIGSGGGIWLYERNKQFAGKLQIPYQEPDGLLMNIFKLI